MPRRVVPIWSLPRRRSEAWSIAMCHGMIRCALPESDDDGGVDAARLELVELGDQHLGVDDAAGADHRDLAGDDAARVARILNVSSPTTIVCPAFGPPW